MPKKGYKQTPKHKAVNKGVRRSPSTEFQKGNPQGKRENNPAWKGGRTNDSNGYVLVKLTDHPYSNNQGYVFEHRLVMEKKICRYLTPQEVVHHINDKPDDNRIENLTLFANNSDHVRFHEREKKNALS